MAAVGHGPGLTVTISVNGAEGRSSVAPWEKLCPASLLRIYNMLDSGDVAACSCTCRSWRDVGQTTKLWRDLLVRETGCPLKQYDTSGVEENYRQMLVDAKTARLWSWGANVFKLAGVSSDSIHLPTEVFLHAIEVGPSVSGIVFSAELHAELRNLPAREVTCAEDFAVVLTWEGQVIDSRGSLANNAPWRHQGRSLAPLSEWPFSQERNQVVAVAAGGTWSGHSVSGGHGAAVTADGCLWVWGSNAQGQLGLGEGSEGWVSLPKKVARLGADMSGPSPAAAVSCGATHTAVILADGSLWVAGSNELGCCGLPESVDEVNEFTQVDLNGHRCSQLAAGDYNTAVLTTKGRVLVCGSNQSAQCGMHVGVPCSHALIDMGPHDGWHGSCGLQRPLEIVKVACGSGTIYALEKGGSTFAWGGGSHGELGIGTSCHAVGTPSKMLLASDVEYITGSAGGRSGAAVDTHGRLFTFGNGRAGQLGQGDTSKRSIARCVKTLQPVVVRRASAGAAFSMAISSWRCPSQGTPPETPEQNSTPNFLSPVASSIFRDPEDTESSSSHFSSLSLRQGGSSLTHAPSLCRNSSAASWNSDGSDGVSTYTSSAGELDDDEDEDDLMTDEAGEAGEADFGRRDVYTHSSSFPGAVNRLAAQGLSHPFMSGARSSLQHLPGAAASAPRTSQGPSRQLRRDLRRQLRTFLQDSTRRELQFPPTLTSVERHQAHALAEAWGLCHQSRGQPPERQLVVWKPSKAIRRTPSALAAQLDLAPPLLERDEDVEADAESDGGH